MTLPAPQFLTPCVDYFLRYVTYDTQADSDSPTCPSTPGQRVLQDIIAQDLRDIGLQDVEVDENGYLFATIPATSTRTDAPTIGFISHVDTSPESSGAGVRPIVHRAWDGTDIVLPDDPSQVLRPSKIPYLAKHIGQDIITASGTTLLGADNKAGVAEIVGAAWYLMQHPEIPHGPIRIGFTPDEEIGRGADRFDVARFGAHAAYTMDGGQMGELEDESFSADAMTVVFEGFNTHPGYAHNQMVNAMKAAGAFLASLPRALSPEGTADRQGFVHPVHVQGGVDRVEVRMIVRDFVTAKLGEHQAQVVSLAEAAAANVPGTRITTTVTETYRNMREVLDQHPRIVALAAQAIEQTGLPVVRSLIRGGTDGSRLSFMGLPTPNIFAGEQNIHSKLEWVSTYDMHKAVEVIVALAQLWEQERV